jgi:hypothetical protein
MPAKILDPLLLKLHNRPKRVKPTRNTIFLTFVLIEANERIPISVIMAPI